MERALLKAQLARIHRKPIAVSSFTRSAHIYLSSWKTLEGASEPPRKRYILHVCPVGNHAPLPSTLYYPVLRRQWKSLFRVLSKRIYGSSGFLATICPTVELDCIITARWIPPAFSAVHDTSAKSLSVCRILENIFLTNARGTYSMRAEVPDDVVLAFLSAGNNLWFQLFCWLTGAEFNARLFLPAYYRLFLDLWMKRIRFLTGAVACYTST